MLAQIKLNQWLPSWTRWWRGQSRWQKFFPFAGVGAFWFLFQSFGVLKSDHLNLGILLLALAYGGQSPRRLLKFILPLLLTAIVYDSQRIYGSILRGEIHVKEPYFFDLTYFGIGTSTGTLTPNQWWQIHAHPVLDAICGFFYIGYIAIFVAMAGYFRIRLGRVAERMMWAFFGVNVAGYLTYYLYPAAPPWYVELYGLGPAQVDAVASPAGALRFDQLLGVQVFQTMYSKSANVFGAIPSLHVAYPMVAVVFSFWFRRFRLLSVLYFSGTAFAAVYLNHHYVLDVLLGALYGVAAALWFAPKEGRA